MTPNLELPIPTATSNQTESTLLTTAHPTCAQTVNSPVIPTPSAVPEETELPTENKEDDNKPFYYALGAGGLAFGWAILSTIGCAYQYITKRKAKSSNDQQETVSLSSQIQTCDIIVKECGVTSKPGKSGIYSFACEKIFFWKNNDTEVYFLMYRSLHVSCNVSI